MQEFFGGLLVRSRVSPSDFSHCRLRATSPVDAIVAYYNGIEGEPWPLGTENLLSLTDEGVLPWSQLEMAIKYHKQVIQKHACDLLFLQFSPTSDALLHALKGASFCGYDYGVFQYVREFDHFNVYSSVIYELLCGFYKELRLFAGNLNEGFLFPSFEAVSRYVQERNRLQELDTGELESNPEEFQVIAVYRWSESSESPTTGSDVRIAL